MEKDILSNKTIGFSVSGAKHYDNEYYTNVPGSFSMLSVTGAKCDCRCAHCDGSILRSMLGADTAERFIRHVDMLVSAGCKGILVSGGSDASGSVPVLPCIDGITYAKKKGLKVLVHTGLIDRATAFALKEAGVDQALTDVIGNERTIHCVYGIDRTPEDYYRSMINCKEAGLEIAPHLVVGLHYGVILGEYNAIDMISRSHAGRFILVVLTPKRGTYMQNIDPPAIDDVLSVFRYAAEKLKNMNIILGCIRPHFYSTRLEKAAVDLGFAAIAYPHPKTIKYSRERGFRNIFYEECCSLFGESLVSAAR